MHRKIVVEILPEVRKRFMSQKDYEDLRTVPYIDNLRKFITKDPEFLAEARKQLPVKIIKKKRPKEESTKD